MLKTKIKNWAFKKWMTTLTLLAVLFNISGMSALPLYQLRIARAQQTRENPWGQFGKVLEQFTTKADAEREAREKQEAEPSQFGIVALLVEKALLDDNTSFDGLRNQYSNLNADTLPERIDRYARALQEEPFTKTHIIEIEEGEATENIAATLQRLYLEGDGAPTEENYLKGIVLIGDVPLPVVNKNGHRFVSMFPYTDFEDPYYIFDAETEDFIVNPLNERAGAEIWHGVIRAPRAGEEGLKLLAEYFDKNYLFHQGNADFTDFEKKVFYSDMEREFALLAVDMWGAYEQYLKYWEDISYGRWNKTWAQEVYQEAEFGKPEGDGLDADGDGLSDEDPVNGYDDDGDGEAGSPLFGLIDLVDNDGDGQVDEDDEGVWGYCSPVPASGETFLEDCQEGPEYKTANFYHTQAGSKYYVTDGVDNDNNGLIDEGIDEDNGDAFIGIDNDRDGRVDEDTSADNNADGDNRTDEDPPGDANGDGCSGECGVDEDFDSLDGDNDFWPDGYEQDYGTLELKLSRLPDFIRTLKDLVKNPRDSKSAFNNLESPTRKDKMRSLPTIKLGTPIGTIPLPRIFPWPKGADWIDEEPAADDDEDGLVDEDGIADNDNDGDGFIDEDPGDAINDAAGDLAGDSFSNLPDIQTRAIIEPMLRRYSQLFDKFFSELNVWVNYTGRYNVEDGDLHTLPYLIDQKDESTRLYLKAVNDVIEEKVDSYVTQLQHDLTVIKGAKLTGSVVLDEDFEIDVDWDDEDEDLISDLSVTPAVFNPEEDSEVLIEFELASEVARLIVQLMDEDEVVLTVVDQTSRDAGKVALSWNGAAPVAKYNLRVMAFDGVSTDSDRVCLRIDNTGAASCGSVDNSSGGAVTSVFGSQALALRQTSYVNFGYQNDDLISELAKKIDDLEKNPSDQLKIKNEVLRKVAGPVDAAADVFVNGLAIDSLTDVAQCSLYRGSQGDGFSQVVEATTLNDRHSNSLPELPPMPPESWQDEDQDSLIGTKKNDYEGKIYNWYNKPSGNSADNMKDFMIRQAAANDEMAGCFYENYEAPWRCFPFVATNSIFSLGGGELVQSAISDEIAYASCFDLKEKRKFDSYMFDVLWYLDQFNKTTLPEDQDALDTIIPDPLEAYRAPRDTVLLDLSDADLVRLADGSELSDIQKTALEGAAALQDYQITLEDVLNVLYGGDRIDNDGDGSIDEIGESYSRVFSFDANGQPNWRQVGELLLSRDRTDEGAAANEDKPFKFRDNFIDGVSELVLEVDAIPGPTVSTLAYHKEPTVDTVQAQSYKLARDANGEYIEDPNRSPEQRAAHGKWLVEIDGAYLAGVGTIDVPTAFNLPLGDQRSFSCNGRVFDYENVFSTNKTIGAMQNRVEAMIDHINDTNENKDEPYCKFFQEDGQEYPSIIGYDNFVEELSDFSDALGRVSASQSVRDALSPTFVATQDATSIPIDSPRYVSFMDQDGNFQKIEYPNVYEINSLEELRQELAELENRLAALQINAAYDEGVGIDGLLQSAIDDALEDDVIRSADGALRVAKGDKLADALLWRAMNIDQKHEYAFKNYLGLANNPYTSHVKAENGYEFLYLQAKGTAQKAQVRFNKDIPEPEVQPEVVPVDCSIPGSENNSACEAVSPVAAPDIDPASPDAERTPVVEDVSGAKKADLTPVFITEWFQALEEWAEETRELYSSPQNAFVMACPVGGLPDLASDEGYLEAPSQAEVLADPAFYYRAPDVNGDGQPDAEEATQALRLSLAESDTNVLRAGMNDQVDVLVEAIDVNGEVNLADRFTEVRLEIDPDEIFDVVTAPTMQLNGGRASFTLATTDIAGTAQLLAVGVENSAVRSQPLNLISSNRNLQITSFIRYSSIYDLQEAGEAGYELLHNGLRIAEIDEATGRITVLNANYDVRVIPAYQDKPVRLAVYRKSDEEILMVLYMVPDSNQDITIQPRDFDFYANGAALRGVHLKDVDTTNQFGLQLIRNSSLMNGAYYIARDQSKIGLIDKFGNIFVTPEINLELKAGGEDDPIVFEIRDKDGNLQFEALIGVEFDVIEEVERSTIENYFKWNAILENIELLTAWLRSFVKTAHAQDITLDGDGDGLKDIEEAIIGTDRQAADTDGNGSSDLEDLLANRNPLDSGEPLFADFGPGQAGFEAVIELYRRGLLLTDASGAVRPDDAITREEFIKLDLGGICIICDQLTEAAQNSVWQQYTALGPFPDQDKVADQYRYCVAQGKNLGIIEGYGPSDPLCPGEFCPQGLMSRAEAAKVILVTSQQRANNAIVISNYPLVDKPWYYNFVITAQREALFPPSTTVNVRGVQTVLNEIPPAEFKTYFDQELSKTSSSFIDWLDVPPQVDATVGNDDISRAEFAMMVAQYIEKYDCLNDDRDGDGLPDKYEELIYGTDPGLADTDGGGVWDGDEIVRGSDPLDAADDSFVADPSVDLRRDDDNDGIKGLDEINVLGTDPSTPDTDGGGLWDNDELLTGNEPVSTPGDDVFGLGDEGIYVSGTVLQPLKIFEIPDLSELSEDQINVEATRQVPADGLSQLYIGATLYDDEGNIMSEETGPEVRFGFLDAEDSKHARITPETVPLNEGYAETVLTSTTLTGFPTVIAALEGEDVPSDKHEINVHALEPAEILLVPNSKIIPSGGLSRTELRAEMFDENGNLTDNGTYQITFEIVGEASAKLDSAIDENAGQAGVQVSSTDGTYSIDLISGSESEQVEVRAFFQDQLAVAKAAGANPIVGALTSENLFLPKAVSASAEIRTSGDMQLRMQADQVTMRADGADTINLRLDVIDGSGAVFADFNGQATVTLQNENFALFENGLSTFDVDIQSGIGLATLNSTLKAGEIVLTTQVDGLNPIENKLQSLAGAPVKLVLETDQDTFDIDPNRAYEITARLFDNNNNFVATDDGTTVNFEITPETREYGRFSGDSALETEDGLAKAYITPGELTGPVRLWARADGLLPAYKEITFVNEFDGLDFRDMQPNVLFGSLLGGGFGDVTSDDYLAGWFVFSGRVQSAVSLSTAPKPALRMAEVTPAGRVTINDANVLETSVIAAEPLRVVVQDAIEERDVFETFMILKPQSEVELVNSVDDAESGVDRVYVVNEVADDTAYQMSQNSEPLRILENDELIAEIYNDGRLVLADSSLNLQVAADFDGKEMAYSLRNGETVIATIIYATSGLGDVKKVPSDFEIGENTEAGVYVRELSDLTDRGLVQAFSGNSTADQKGLFYVNEAQEVAGNQLPGQNYLSIESASEQEGAGFIGDNKHALLFAAGNSAGEANLPYASDAGIVLGDPTIRLNNQEPALTSKTGFTPDIGEIILIDSDNIFDVAALDFDNDNDSDLMVSFNNGDVRLVENVNRGNTFIDRGVFLNFPNGIISTTAGDINADGWDDLLVATEDSCVIGEVCVNAFLNNQGNFERTNLNLANFDANNRVYQIEAEDMNNDGYVDLITSDDRGYITIFHNVDGVINTEGQLVGDLGPNIDNNLNLKTEVMINYDGMIGNDGSQDYFEEISGVEFKNLARDGLLGVSSTKFAKDLTPPLDNVANGDEVNYQIVIENISGSNGITPFTISNLEIADILPSVMRLEKDDIKCLDCVDPIEIEESGMSLRPFILSGINVPPGESRTISYTVRVEGLPRLNIHIGNDLTDKYSPQGDGLPDIAATPEYNPGGVTVYFHSVSRNGRDVEYDDYVYEPGGGPSSVLPVINPETGEEVGLNLEKILDGEKDKNGVPLALKNLQNFGSVDPPQADGSGLSLSEAFPNRQVSPVSTTGLEGDTIAQLPGGLGDAYQALGRGLDEAAAKVEGALAALKCAGGCIPMPINYAFFAPGPINALGAPSGFDFGSAIFGWGAPNPSTVCSGPACFLSAGGRIYLSPTLTGKLATAVCIGPWGTPTCFPYVLPIKDITGVCDEIAGAIEDTLAGVNGAITTLNETSAMINQGINQTLTGQPSGPQQSGGLTTHKSIGTYPFKASISTNVRIPGFPSVLTDWLDAQSNEIINKLSDLPDIYIIWPDVAGFVGSNTEAVKELGQTLKNTVKGKKAVQNEPATPRGLKQILMDLNKIPLISIRSEEVLIKIPALTPAEIDRFVNDARQWVEDEKNELNRAMAAWQCGPFQKYDDPEQKLNPYYIDIEGEKVYGEPPWKQACDIVIADMSDLIKSVEKNIQIVEGYKEIPRQVLAWRNMLTKYVIQIVCYIDAIINFFVGNTAKLMSQAEEWVIAGLRVYELIMTWKALFDLVIDYQASCDKCTTARFTLLELVLKLFAYIPDPPVIPFPKLPDLYFDFSQIQAGIEIYWPNVKFRPEKIVLPRLPRIYLPDLPTVRIDLPAIPELPDLSLSLPELPDLPPLPLPVLPDLPPPPKIPEFPVAIKATISIVKKIFKLLCLIKLGFMPVSETALKPTIEHMTERGLEPLLPLDLGLAFQLPGIEYDYLDRIELTTIVNLNIEFTQIADFVKNVANGLNKKTTNFVEFVNKLSEKAEEKAAEAAAKVNQSLELLEVPDVDIDLGGSDSDDVFDVSQADAFTKSEYQKFAPELSESIAGLGSVRSELEKEAARMQQLIDSEEYQDITLIAQVEYFDASNHRNASIEDLADVELQLETLGDGFEETKLLADLRGSLLDFASENQNLDLKLEDVDNLETFGKIIAQSPTIEHEFAEAGILAGQTLVAEESTLVAENPSLTDAVSRSGLDAGSLNQSVPTGVFIYNEDEQINEKLIEYEDELSSQATLLFEDIDGDGDGDFIYSFGSNLYFKRNYNGLGGREGFYGGLPVQRPLNDFAPVHEAISGLRTTFENNSVTDLSWNESDQLNLAGYELFYAKSLENLSDDLNGPGINKVIFMATQFADAITSSEPQENAYAFPSTFAAEIYVDEINGDVVYAGPETSLLNSGSSRRMLAAGNQIYSPDGAEIRVFSEGAEFDRLRLEAHQYITLPDSFEDEVEIDVASGTVHLINQNKIVLDQQLFAGAKIELDQVLKADSRASAVIRLPGNSYARLEAEQTLKVQALPNPEQPNVTLELPNGFYYGAMRSFDQTGFRSTLSETVLLSPNLCSDRQAPLPNAGAATRDVALFKSVEIDASASFDAFGEVVGYYLDLDPDVDLDGDGDASNDNDASGDLDPAIDSNGDGIPDNDLDNARFKVGPYNELGDHKVVLNIIDQSGNRAQQEIDIKVFVPDIFLNEFTANEGQISGYIEPPIDDYPVVALRNRSGVVDVIATPSADANDKYFTDEDGNFVIDDLELDDTVVIRDATGTVVATIDPETGRVLLNNPLYKLDVLEAEEPLLPTRVVVIDPNGQIISTIFVVSDANVDATIVGADFEFTADSVVDLIGSHIKSLASDQFELRTVPGNAELYAGGVEIVNSDSELRAAVLDTGGNFYIFDNRIDLELKPAADLAEPMVISVTASGAVIAEFFVAFKTGRSIEIVSAENFRVFVGGESVRGELFDTDKDGMPDVWEQQYRLNLNDASDANEDPDQDGLTNLEEYNSKTDPFNPDSDGDSFEDGFEKIFGNDPNEAATSPFVDVTPDNEFYDSILNFNERGIFDGIPTVDGRAEFGWEIPITRAEFAKVILDVYCIVPREKARSGPLVFSDIPYIEGEVPWYFAITKEALYQGFITGYRDQIDVRTGLTPFAPNEEISQAEAVKIILEGLERDGFIDLSGLGEYGAWYDPFMDAAQDLTPYVVPGKSLQNTFILTPDEIVNPENSLKRGEFIRMAERVLTATDCSLLDGDGDGLPDFWEDQNGSDRTIDDADDDPDRDGLDNLTEYKYGSSPVDADTDGGGILDGVEILQRRTNPLDAGDDLSDSDGDGLSDQDETDVYGTNPLEADTDGGGISDGVEVLQLNSDPLDGADDLDTDGDLLPDQDEIEIYGTDPLDPDTDDGGVEDGAEVFRGTDPLFEDDDLIDPRSDLAEGVYVIQEPCTACPCISGIDHTADLIDGDRVLCAIANQNVDVIFKQSNTVDIESTRKP